MRSGAACMAMLLACWMSAAAAPPTTVSLAQYKAELQRFDAAIDEVRTDRARLADLLSSLPDKWKVEERDRHLEVSTDWLRNALLQMPRDEAGSKKAAESLHQRLHLLSSEADGYGVAASAAAERARLDGILARREFQNVSGPTIWDRLKQKLLNWLISILSRVFGSRAVPAIGKTFVWLVILAGVAFLSLWIWRLLSRAGAIPSIATEVAAISAKSWSEWLAEARAAERRGDWRNAVRLAYWAGISSLESRGLWRPDRGRTPREYLRLLESGSEYRPSLLELTQIFERTWYGREMADRAAFSRSIEQLARMGCQ